MSDLISSDIVIRGEREADAESVWCLNAEAFPTPAEANLVNVLKRECECLSLVAEHREAIVGHILFSPVTLEDQTDLKLFGLAPMAVNPSLQNRGVGSLLVEEGIARCRREQGDAIVVLGHPNYYPRFGFRPSVQFGLRSDYDVPDDVFMLLELRQGVFSNSGRVESLRPSETEQRIVRYNRAFDAV